jgi:hypothetical protein
LRFSSSSGKQILERQKHYPAGTRQLYESQLADTLRLARIDFSATIGLPLRMPDALG